MIEMRRAQRSFGDGLIAEEVRDLRESWMEHADRLLDDETVVAAVYEALARRHPRSRNRGRRGTPAEMVLRLLILKHVRNWSYEILEREVRANGRWQVASTPIRGEATRQLLQAAGALVWFCQSLSCVGRLLRGVKYS